MQIIIYALIALLATFMGAITGMGGGIVMKPVFDLLGQYNAATIGVLSSATVFAMSLVSVSRHLIMKTPIILKLGVWLSLGSVLGGILGQSVFEHVDSILNSNANIVIIQNVLLIILIIAVLIYMNYKNRVKPLEVTNLFASIICGIILGFISSFLGIGGGPFNVAIILYVFECSTRIAAVYSIFTILFAQLTKLLAIMFTTGFAQYDLSILPVTIACGVIGSFFGTKFNNSLKDTTIEYCFTGMQLFILGIAAINIIRNI